MCKNLDRWLGRTAYQIMPDRFCKVGVNPKAMPGRVMKNWDDRMPNWKPNSEGEYTNDYFYCGNLKGVKSKLNYLRDLGFDMIYLTPITLSNSYHHYDVCNHMEIDPWLGTWKDFNELCEKAHKLGILIVVDLVFNHAGISSVYYNNSKYREWFKRKPNGEPVFWWGFKDLPECDTLNPYYQQEMLKVATNYLENGADGFRLDLAENLPKEFLQAIQMVKDKYPNTIVIGEMWGIATDKQDPKILDGQLDPIMNYPMADGILRWVRYGEAGHFRYIFDRVFREYPEKVQNLLLNNIATHDTPTTLTMLGGDIMNANIFDRQIWDIERPWNSYNGFDTYHFREYEANHDAIQGAEYVKAKVLTQVAIAIMYMLPGIPCIYQGTEVYEMGYKDPFNRKPFNWNIKEKEMKLFISTMGAIRREHSDVFRDGAVRIVDINEDILILERFSSDNKRIILVVNRTPEWKFLHNFFRGVSTKILYSTVNVISGWINEYGIVILRQ